MSGEADAPFLISNGVTQLNSAATGVQLAGNQTGGGLIQVLISNTSGAIAAVAYANDGTTSQTNAAVPGAGTTSASGVIVMAIGVTAVYTVPPNQFWSASAAGIFIQIGTGN